MKKIIVLFILALLLSSCGNRQLEQKEEVKKVETSNVEVNNVKKNKNITEKEEKITFSVVEDNFQKLKNLDSNKLEELNFMIKDFYSRDILEKTKISGDLRECDNLDENQKENCKREIIISKGDEKLCDTFSNTGSINNCKNEVFRTKAQKTLDEKLCDNIIDNSQEKFKVNSCKSTVLFNKAVNNLDTKICNKILVKEEKDMCFDVIKMEKENKDKIEKIEKDIK